MENQQIIEKLEQKILDRLSEEYYSPSDSYELYDNLTNTYYNFNGDILRDPSEYDYSTEGHTPFGDE